MELMGQVIEERYLWSFCSGVTVYVLVWILLKICLPHRITSGSKSEDNASSSSTSSGDPKQKNDVAITNSRDIVFEDDAVRSDMKTEEWKPDEIRNDAAEALSGDATSDKEKAVMGERSKAVFMEDAIIENAENEGKIKYGAVKVDKAKADKAKYDPVRAGTAKLDKAKDDAAEKAKADKTKADAALAEKAKTDKARATMVDKAMVEKAKADKAKSEAALAQKGKTEQSKADAAIVENAKADKAKHDVAMAEKAKADKAKADAAQAEKTKAEKVKASAPATMVDKTKADLGLKSSATHLNSANADQAKGGTAKADAAKVDKIAEAAKAYLTRTNSASNPNQKPGAVKPGNTTANVDKSDTRKSDKKAATAPIDPANLKKTDVTKNSGSTASKGTAEFEQMATHHKCRGKHYDGNDGGADRFKVPDNLVKWDKPFKDYKPVQYTAKFILEEKPFWADPDVSDKTGYGKIKFNQLDGPTDRKSFTGKYEVADGLPLNPIGRTGITGRGMLGKWGPNHAADPIVTRWKRDAKGQIVRHPGAGNKPILEFVSIQRGDTQEWAIPGGMVDANEEVSLTLKREFNEEALNSLEGAQKEQTKKDIQEVFKNGDVVFKGYVDDPRNTDNAWMETVACNFHDEDGTTVGRIPLSAGDDARAVQWLTIDKPLQLYASHSRFVEAVCTKRGAYFSRMANSLSYDS